MKTHEQTQTPQNGVAHDYSFKPAIPRNDPQRRIAQCLAISSVAAFCVVASVAQTLSDGLVAYYPFNGNANDASGNGNNGIPTNGAHVTTDKSGQANSAFEFDGVNDFIQVETSISLQSPTNAITISVWANAYAFDNGYAPLLAKSDRTSAGGQYGLYFTESGSLTFEFVNGYRSVALPSLPGLNQWHQYSITYDGQAVWFYFDGSLFGSAALSGAFQENTLALRLGGDAPGIAEYFSGKLDEFRIYNRALSQDEIRTLYIMDADTVGGLVAHYSFNGSATNILGTGNDGVVNGATLSNDRVGIANSAYAFTGTSKIDFPSGPPVATQASFTYSFWMISTLVGAYPANPPNTWSWFLDRTSVTTSLCSLGMLTDSIGTNSQGQFCFLPRYDDNTQPPGNNELGAGIVGGALTPQVWQHIAMVREYGNSFKLYVDGKLVGSAPDNGKSLTVPEVVLGKNPNYGEQGLVGKFDDFRIYNRALTPYEATALYYDGPPWLKTVPSTLVVGVGGNADLSVTAIGSLPLSYQWSLNGGFLAGETGSTLHLTGLQASQAGTYSVFVTNAFGSSNVPVLLSLLDLKMFAGLVLAGTVNSHYRIEFQPAVVGANTWQMLTNVTLTASPSVFFDIDSPKFPMRFYRAVPIP